MLTVKTSRVSTVKSIFCLTIALLAIVGLGVLPVYEWATGAARGASHATAPAARVAPGRAGKS